MRRLFAGAVALGLAVIGAAAASPATAAELPDYETITAIDYDGVIYTIDPVTGEASDPWETGIDGEPGGLTLDDDGRGYLTTITGPWASTLWSVDVVTRTVTQIADLTAADDAATTGACLMPQLFDGALYAYCGFYEDPGTTNTFSRIDPATGEFMPLFVFSTGGTEDVFPVIDPADGTVFFTSGPTIYLFDFDTLDVDDLDSFPDYKVGEFSAIAAGSSFSTGSIMWTPAVDLGAVSTQLETWDRATGDTSVVGEITADGESLFIYALTVWGAAPAPAPQLAATGAETAAPGILITGMLLAAGIPLVLATRRRSTSA